MAVPIEKRRRVVATIGVFDGVHRGHRALLEAVRRSAARRGAIPAAVTFRPPPAAVLAPDSPLREITPWPVKRALLAGAGMERVLALRFTPKTAALAPETFVRELLLRELDLAALVVGYDFHFGFRGAGDAVLLRRLGRALGFRVRALPAVRCAGSPVSSTRIRAAVARGAVAAAAAMLGRPFAVTGRVVPGRGLGARLFVPTANLRPVPTQLVPAAGVYLSRVRARGRVWGAVTHVGPLPTLGLPETAPIETHLLGFQGDLAGARLEVEFLARRRPSRRFAGVARLREAIARDVRWAERALARGGENDLVTRRGRC
jgi:riboflavin kinase / FMN adenylyltransferase